jgi:hemolysin activation/secretion protein
MHYLEVFGTHANNMLPVTRFEERGARRFENQSLAGVHYHLNMLTPYWDPESGFQFDGTYAAGFPVLGQPSSSQKVSGQLSGVQSLPAGLGWLSETRLAARAYGGVGLPRDVELFTLGGSQLFRGFDLAERQGNMIWIGSVEWRVPLARDLNCDLCDHAVGIRNAYLATFYDVGDVYLRGRTVGPIAHGVGAGLRLDLAWFSFFEHTIVRFDVSRTVNADSPFQFWFGIEHPF